MELVTLRTERLRLRPLVPGDLEACYRLHADLGWLDAGLSEAENRQLRAEWLDWSIRNDVQLLRLKQPPYGDRAVVEQVTGALIGLAGYVPIVAPFQQLPSFGGLARARWSPEVGLFWAISPGAQRRGFATEAAAALAHYAFTTLALGRLVATTDHNNTASMAVMRRLGMRVERNVAPEPDWFQSCGMIEYAEWRARAHPVVETAAVPLHATRQSAAAP